MAARLEKLKTRADFLRVAAARRTAAGPGVVVQAATRPDQGSYGLRIRVGFTASRKVGNAVIRNRAKRRLRAVAARVLPDRGTPGTDYVLIARAGTAARPFLDLTADLEGALRRIARSGPDLNSAAEHRSSASKLREGRGKTRSSHKPSDEARQARHNDRPQ